MTEFNNKVAFVTGGGSGIGRGLALALAAEGAAVAVADIIADNAHAVAADITAAGGRAVAIAGDVCERRSVHQMKDAANQALGPVSLLFANAGVTCFDQLTDLPDSEIDWVIEVNLFGVLHCLQAFLPDMIAAKSGHVVATSSMAGLIPGWVPRHVPYVAAKAGVIGMMLNLREDLAPFGVGCTVLCPGGVATNITQSPAYRPARFGGPGSVPVAEQTGFLTAASVTFRSPEQVAQMVLNGMRKNRAMVLTDHTRRELFMTSYAGAVMTAFDDAAAFDG
jgi:NAD(P)-dependent dehydrogenase (short-subunit alcohol dehydrogenase family)